jgi:hypothetical protein
MIIQKTQTKEVKQEKVSSTEEIEYSENALCNVIIAVKDVLSKLREDENDLDSPQLFRTIAIDNGQLSRIKNNTANEEYGIVFPAIFMHFINVRYLVQQSRIGEGRATLRIRYILNRLNNSDPEHELEGFRMFQRINVALQDAKSTHAALNERFQLEYFDQPESFDDGLQQYWIDYEVWFRETSAYKFRNYVDRYLVVPPFTNHSDQNPESNTNEHEDHNTPKYEDVSGITLPTNE